MDLFDPLQVTARVSDSPPQKKAHKPTWELGELIAVEDDFSLIIKGAHFLPRSVKEGLECLSFFEEEIGCSVKRIEEARVHLFKERDDLMSDAIAREVKILIGAILTPRKAL